MQLKDAISLINYGAIAEKTNAHWADLGCGPGLFTFALANLLQKGSSIFAIDKNNISLQSLSNPNNIAIFKEQKDFIKYPVSHQNLDGILMANSLHYVADQINFIANTGRQLSSAGIFLIVEYDTDKSNQWVPYPASPLSLQKIFAKAGYNTFILLNEITSRYNSGKMYSAIIKK
jgi:ubiquinone/menaquinone biosynthesis C-methylase UbiE